MYDIRDVLRKGISIAELRKKTYEQAREDEGDMRMRLIYNIMIKSSQKDIDNYEKLIASVSDNMAEIIDFAVYDKISSLVNQFARTIVKPNTRDRKELVRFALNQEKALYALIIDIQGRMVTDEATSGTIAYYVLMEVIEEKKRVIGRLEQMSR